MSKRKRTVFITVWVLALIAVLAAALAIGPTPKSESVQGAMRDAVLHGDNQISLFGLKAVIPRFTLVPGKFQLVLEELVHFFDQLASTNSPHRHKFLGAYIFGAGVYIFAGTMFELIGLQGITTHGTPITLPAPLADINAAIALGCFSYLVILSGGIAGNGLKGIGLTLKEFSLPISMSFRLFGALLSGMLVTELVYYYTCLSFVLPVVVGILFTLMHALIQTYVLTMLTSVFYGEVSEPAHKTKEKNN